MLSRWQSTIVDEQGNVQPLANLTVRLESDQSLAKMWASPGTTQPLPDGMVQADGNGYAYFYAEGGLYRIQSDDLNIDWRHVPLGDLQGMDEADLGLGTAATRNVGTGPDDVPSNDMLPSSNVLQWLGTPIGKEFSLHPDAPLPPTNDPRFRYVILTAGLTGSGKYNAGVLTNESVSGSDPTITATAKVNLSGSPLHGKIIDLINTSRVFLRPGSAAGSIVDSKTKAHTHSIPSLTASGSSFNSTTAGSASITYASEQSGFNGIDDETAPRYIPRVYLMRIK